MKDVVILVPAYQCEETIAETLRSIQAQGEALARVKAVIIADDGSKDRTREVARESWQAATPLQILGPLPNRGEYVNVNQAVAGFSPEVEWFLIMHADNVAKPGWLSTLLSAIEQADDRVGTISSSWDDWAADGSTTPGEDNPARAIEHIGGDRASVRGTIRRGCWWHISSCAIRVRAYGEVGGLPKGLRLKGDWDFLLRLLRHGWTVDYIPRTLMLYRENPAGSSSLTFRLHKDVKETLQVVRWHRDALTTRDLIWIHGYQLRALARRAAKAVFTGDLRRLFNTLPASFGVASSLASCLSGRIPPREVTAL